MRKKKTQAKADVSTVVQYGDGGCCPRLPALPRCSSLLCILHPKTQTLIFKESFKIHHMRDVSRNISSLQLMNYLLLYNKNIRFDFDDELTIGDVRYDNMI